MAALNGITALVTGATGGIGVAVARRLAADGARVAVADRAPTPELTALADELGGTAVTADLTSVGEIDTMVAEIEPVGLLVCNAAYMTMAPLVEHDEADWWRVVDTNLSGTFHLVQAVLPGMKRLGAGRVVVIASEWGVTGWPNAGAYAASKAGLIALTKSLGAELGPHGIAVNAVAPGVTDTPQLRVDAEDAGVDLATMRARYAEAIPLGRIGRPEEIAAAVALLADPAVGAFAGQTIQVNGGSTRCRA
ncbi:SDR family NAD(P)-dependent oxidoreductase [Pseudonocardia acaciae]|uniref:SDR family NAD(P)-dependent oxidoreductase n=1 Tax=Pseudonocardia acaciae TaxID=551276 RepID=UPI0004920416|nr:SDR family oxidoreductase [Pseudonocardia acaciae]